MNIRNALLKLAHNKKAKNYGTDNQKGQKSEFTQKR